MTTPWLKRLISPSGLAFAALCFFFPFFSISCSGMMGSLEVTYSGMALAFNGTPSVSGALASELSSADIDDLRTGAQPLLLLALISLLVGVGLSAGLPNALARSVSTLASGGIALLMAVLNQVAMTVSAEEEIRSSMDGQAQLADLQADTGIGIWLLSLALVAVSVWAVLEIVLQRRGPGPRMMTAAGMPPGPGGPFGPPPPGQMRPGQVSPGPGPFGPPPPGQVPPGQVPPRPGPHGPPPPGSGSFGPPPPGQMPPGQGRPGFAPPPGQPGGSGPQGPGDLR